jgi:RNA polymerase sigma-70 factor (ECF subfamily)
MTLPADRPAVDSPVSTTVAGEDDQSIAEAKAGSLEAFEALVARHHGRVYNFLWQLTRSVEDAEDLTQETFVRAYRGIHSFKTGSRFGPWIFTIARRSAIDALRRKTPTEPLTAEMADTVASESEGPSHEGTIWNTARQLLKPSQYEALWLTYGEGFSNAETAAVMRTNVIHVKVLLHRGRSALRKRLERTAV